MVDVEIVKLPYAIKTEPVGVGDPSASPIEFITEDKGLNLDIDEYEKYDPEPGEDERIKRQGGIIPRSEMTLTDSGGNNRTVVKKID